MKPQIMENKTAIKTNLFIKLLEENYSIFFCVSIIEIVFLVKANFVGRTFCEIFLFFEVR